MFQLARLWSSHTGSPQTRIPGFAGGILAALQSRDRSTESLRLSVVDRSVSLALSRLSDIDTIARSRSRWRSAAKAFLEGNGGVLRHMEGPSCDFHAAPYVVLDAVLSDTRASSDDLL